MGRRKKPSQAEIERRKRQSSSAPDGGLVKSPLRKGLGSAKAKNKRKLETLQGNKRFNGLL